MRLFEAVFKYVEVFVSLHLIAFSKQLCRLAGLQKGEFLYHEESSNAICKAFRKVVFYLSLNSHSKRFCVMQNERIRNVKKWIFVWLVFGCKRTDAPVEKRRSADWRMVEKCRKRECFQQNNA